MGLIQIVLSILLPPIAVAIYKGVRKDFLINLLLTIILWLPGVVHAFYVQTK